MWRREIRIRDRCRICDVPVYCGPFIAAHEGDVIDIGDTIQEAMPCPRCGTELAYYVEREWDDSCYVCGSGSADRSPTAEWQPHRQRYRWWCEACDDALFASLLAELSPRLARTFWYPLAWASAVFGFGCDIEWRLRERWRRKA